MRRNDPVGMRARVLDAAARGFQETGFRGTSVSDVMRAASVSGGALHHHFPAKMDLAVAVVRERVMPEVGDTWIEAVRRSPVAIDAIIGVFEDVAASLDRAGGVRGCPLGNIAVELSLADEPLRIAVEEGYRRWRDAIAVRLREDGERCPAAARGDEDGFADLVVALFSGAMSVAKAEQSAEVLRSCSRQLRRMAVR